ncbi:MAG: response regulator [Candidatus Margulisiibacteriota bacterium]|jgi:DNA-binding response OmpR family regulator
MEKILIIDDSKMNRELAKMALEDAGYTIIEAENGKQGIEIAKQEQPDLILLDILMPDISGFEVCKTIKNEPKTQQIPVIFLTALEEMASKKEGFEIGADDYITKPYIIEELLLRVELILRIKREKDSLRSRSEEISKNTDHLTTEQAKLIQKEKELLLRQIYVSLHHEIRNPLTTILLGSQLIKNMLPEKTPEKRVIEEIIHCSKRIRTIMDNLGKMKDIQIDEYAEGTEMVNLNKK